MASNIAQDFFANQTISQTLAAAHASVMNTYRWPAIC